MSDSIKHTKTTTWMARILMALFGGVILLGLASAFLGGSDSGTNGNSSQPSVSSPKKESPF